MSFEAVHTTLESRFKEFWANTTGVEYQNIEFRPDSDIPWTKFEIFEGPVTPVSTGDILYRHQGQIATTIYVPLKTGTAYLKSLCDLAAGIYRGKQIYTGEEVAVDRSFETDVGVNWIAYNSPDLLERSTGPNNTPRSGSYCYHISADKGFQGVKFADQNKVAIQIGEEFELSVWFWVVPGIGTERAKILTQDVDFGNIEEPETTKLAEWERLLVRATAIADRDARLIYPVTGGALSGENQGSEFFVEDVSCRRLDTSFKINCLEAEMRPLGEVSGWYAAIVEISYYFDKEY